MAVSPDLLTQYVNRKQFDIAKQALEGMVDEGYHFRNFSSINAVRAIVTLALNVDSLRIPASAFARYHLTPECNQLMTILRLESIKLLNEHGYDDQQLIERLGKVAIDVLSAASDGAPESLKASTFNTFVRQLLQGNYPKVIGMRASAFKLYRDAYLSQDLGL